MPMIDLNCSYHVLLEVCPALDGVPVLDENAPELNELEVPEGVRQILSITLLNFFRYQKDHQTM